MGTETKPTTYTSQGAVHSTVHSTVQEARRSEHIDNNYGPGSIQITSPIRVSPVQARVIENASFTHGPEASSRPNQSGTTITETKPTTYTSQGAVHSTVHSTVQEARRSEHIDNNY